MRWAMAQPCMGSTARIVKISRSKVPCRRKVGLLMNAPRVPFPQLLTRVCLNWTRRARGELEPAAAIGHPPTHDEDGDGGSQRPPKRQNEISYQTQECEKEPEDLSFHVPSLRRNSLGQSRTPAGLRDR